MPTSVGRGSRLRSPGLIGAVLLVLVLVALFGVYQKERIGTMLSSGDEFQAEFARAYRLVPNKSEVKVGGVVVGTVTEVEQVAQGHSLTSMKISENAKDKLGSAPSAIIRPTTLLGGNYYVELTPGGVPQPFSGDRIPLNRTHIPAELDQILAAIPGRAQQSIQNTTRLTDQTMQAGGGRSLGNVLQDAPNTLGPASGVLESARGTRPDQDLYRIVPDVNAMSTALNRHDGQLGQTIDSLQQVSGTLSAQRRPLAETIASLPETLSSTRSGLDSLRGSVNRLTTTATNARPAVQELGPLLKKTDPVVQEARPLVSELRPLARDVRPMVDELIPTSDRATSTMNLVRGPVLDRVNGPIANAVLSPWKGTGPYQGDGGNGHPLYQELGYLASHTANLSKYGDKNGRMLGLGLGAGVSSVGGNDPGTAQFLQSLGLLPGGSVQLLPPPNNSNDGWSPEPATKPGPLQLFPNSGAGPNPPQPPGN